MASTNPKPKAPPPPPPPLPQSKPPRNPTDPPLPPLNPNSNSNNPPPPKPLPLLNPTQEDVCLSRASHLTRPELLRRRSRYLKQLSRCYRDYYWALMEELKIQYREYYWKFGVSPFKQDQIKSGERERERENGLDIEGIGENIEGNNNINTNTNNNINHSNSNNNLNNVVGISSSNNNVGGSSGGNHRCAFVGCKLKPMALTNFCHLHILSDSKQKLYKACSYVIKSAQAGPITCGKPILRSTVPSLCTVHLQKAQKHVSRALKKAGLNVTSSAKVAPKFHVIVAEYVRQTQAKRRAARRAITNDVDVKEEVTS